MSERMIVVSSDCHAGLPIADYKPYVEEKFHEILDMAVPITIEQSQKASESFLIKERFLLEVALVVLSVLEFEDFLDFQ